MNKLNTTFITQTPLHSGDIVKISPNDPTQVTKFSPDYSIQNIIVHPNETLIDIINYHDMSYILGSDSTGYFIYLNNIKHPLGQFKPIVSPNGNLISLNNYLYLLLPYQGSYILNDGRTGYSNKGLLCTLTLELKLIGIRPLALASSFLLFGSDTMLFLLNGTYLSRFNPTTSPSWTTSISPDFVNACIFNTYVIVIHTNTITTYDMITGHILYTQMVTDPLFACQTIRGQVYLVTINKIFFGTVSHLGYKITGSQIWPQQTIPTFCNLGSYTEGYLIATENAIYLIDNQITIIPFTDLATIRSFRVIPLESKSQIPCILNGITKIQTHLITDLPPYAVQTTIQTNYPILAGIVTQVVSPTYANVVFTGTINKSPLSLIPNHIYGIDLKGSLHINDTSHPFLITAPDGSITIIYHP